MSSMTDEDVRAEDIRALTEALAKGPTPGEWITDPVNQNLVCVDSRPYEYIAEVAPSEFSETHHDIERERADARWFAAASPLRIARLLAERESLVAEVGRLRAATMTGEQLAMKVLTIQIQLPNKIGNNWVASTEREWFRKGHEAARRQAAEYFRAIDAALAGKQEGGV